VRQFRRRNSRKNIWSKSVPETTEDAPMLQVRKPWALSKTWQSAIQIVSWAICKPKSRVAIVGSVGLDKPLQETIIGLCKRHGFRLPRWNAKKAELKWPNGSIAAFIKTRDIPNGSEVVKRPRKESRKEDHLFDALRYAQAWISERCRDRQS